MSEVRLIDANALKAKIQSKYDYDDAEFDRGYNIGLKAAVEIIDNAPTVTPEQERPNNYHDSHSDYWDNIGRVDEEAENE